MRTITSLKDALDKYLSVTETENVHTKSAVDEIRDCLGKFTILTEKSEKSNYILRFESRELAKSCFCYFPIKAVCSDGFTIIISVVSDAEWKSINKSSNF